MKISIPYGKTALVANLEDVIVEGILDSKLQQYTIDRGESDLVKDALMNPIESEPLSVLAKGKDNIVILASDHTRPVPSKHIIPSMIKEIKKGNPHAKIKILIATGCHRGMTDQELIDKFGEDILKEVTIEMHCSDNSVTEYIGKLPSGGDCYINKTALDADLLISEGFIEPHFFAGFSGGRKSVMPGVASKSTVLPNHCSKFIDDIHSRTGILEGNLIHQDMVWAARKAKLVFIVNVIINHEKKIIHAVAGDLERAHEKGCEFISTLCKVEAKPSDIVITSNGGYPLDQNVYQAVKGMTAAEVAVKAGGVIIMIAQSEDGIGGDNFYHQLADEKDITKTMKCFMGRNQDETVADQWQSQIFIRILQKATVIYISQIQDETISALHMTPAKDIEMAVNLAKSILNKKNPSVTVIPDGVSVIVNKK